MSRANLFEMVERKRGKVPDGQIGFGLEGGSFSLPEFVIPIEYIGQVLNSKDWQERSVGLKYGNGICLDVDSGEIVRFCQFDCRDGKVLGEYVDPSMLEAKGYNHVWSGLVLRLQSCGSLEDDIQSIQSAFEQVTLRYNCPVVVVIKGGKYPDGVFPDRKLFVRIETNEYTQYRKEKRLAVRFRVVGQTNDELVILARTRKKPKRQPVNALAVTSDNENWKQRLIEEVEGELARRDFKAGFREIDRTELERRLESSKVPIFGLQKFRDGEGRILEARCGCTLWLSYQGDRYLLIGCGDDSCLIYSSYALKEEDGKLPGAGDESELVEGVNDRYFSLGTREIGPCACGGTIVETCRLVKSGPRKTVLNWCRTCTGCDRSAVIAHNPRLVVDTKMVVG